MLDDVPPQAVAVNIHGSIFELKPGDWNDLLEPGNPFMDYRFLAACETAGVVGPRTAWEPRHLTVHREGKIVGAAPFYKKRDSYGEFIFDFQWAEAYARAGLPYYPKGIGAAPFTPAAGRRFLTHPEDERQVIVAALWQGMQTLTDRDGLSSQHVLFCSQDEQEILTRCGALPRLTFQFHWENQGYTTFDDFLDALRAPKRKQIRKEREALRQAGIDIVLLAGNDIQTEHIDATYDFYRRNQSDKWGQAYLNRAWFETIHATMRENLVLTLARKDGRWLGGSFNFRKDNHLYGRYWGCSARIEFLHFECCYYRLIDYAIAEGIRLYEAGAQGEHKFLRGFATRPTYSAHHFAHPGAHASIADYLQRETAHAKATILDYNRQSPLKNLRAAAETALAGDGAKSL